MKQLTCKGIISKLWKKDCFPMRRPFCINIWNCWSVGSIPHKIFWLLVFWISEKKFAGKENMCKWETITPLYWGYQKEKGCRLFFSSCFQSKLFASTFYYVLSDVIGHFKGGLGGQPPSFWRKIWTMIVKWITVSMLFV